METDGSTTVNSEGAVEPRSFGHQTTQSTMSIEEILTLAQTATLEQVIQEGNNMVCQVSSKSSNFALFRLTFSNTTFLIFIVN